MLDVPFCPICKSTTNKISLFAKNFPFFASPVAALDKKNILEKYGEAHIKGMLGPVVCGDCGHIYLCQSAPEHVLEDLYGKYYSYPSALEGSFFPQRDEAFLHIFNQQVQPKLSSTQKRVLEIGCYDGYVLYHLKKNGFIETGCDPSHGADIGLRFGVNIKKMFFNAMEFKQQGFQYDCIIFRHLLEHVADPPVFLKTLNEVMAKNALVVFEVPNVEVYLKSGDTGVFSFQHLQYFSKVSITKTLAQAGLSLVECIEHAENLIVVACHGSLPKLGDYGYILGLCEQFKINMSSKKEKLWRMINEIKAQNLVLWGAGGYSASVMEMCDVPRRMIKYIVDSDQKKWGMRYLNNDIPIVSPESLKADDYGCLLICSMYVNEIAAKARTFNARRPMISVTQEIKII